MRQALLTARKVAGLTQEQVARAAGIDRSAYNRIERGHQNPTVDAALAISRILNRRVEDLFMPADVHLAHNNHVARDEQAATRSA